MESALQRRLVATCALRLIFAGVFGGFAQGSWAVGKGIKICDTLKITLPDAREDFDRNTFYRDGILYLMATWVPELTSSVKPTDASLVVSCASLPASVQIAIVNSTLPSGEFDFNAFRNRIGLPYLESRSKLHANFAPHATLDEFKAISHFEKWPVRIFQRSRVKGLTRAIYQSPKDLGYELSVAVTHNSTDGDLSKDVRETELILRRNDGSKNWDFYVYEASGKLVPESHLVRPDALASPSVCMNCHFSSDDRAFVPLLRSGLGVR